MKAVLPCRVAVHHDQHLVSVDVELPADLVQEIEKETGVSIKRLSVTAPRKKEVLYGGKPGGAMADSVQLSRSMQAMVLSGSAEKSLHSMKEETMAQAEEWRKSGHRGAESAPETD